MMFGSDNAVGVSPEVMAAISAVDDGYEVAYGDDQWSLGLDAAYSDFFERESFVFPVTTGTGANALALAAITPPYGEIFCHQRSHIFTTECGAPEFFSGGARLVTGSGADGKLTLDGLNAYVETHRPNNRHHLIPSALSLTQATELGTVYTPEEIQRLAEAAHCAGMKVHMDGARLANALVKLNAPPASITWQAGVDVLSLGTTKNGTMNAEAVIVFDAALARDIALRHKRAGMLISKMRYVSAQLLQILENRLWERNARRANEAASQLAAILQGSGHALLRHPVETNQIFVELDDAVIQALDAAKIRFRRWGLDDPPCYRLVTSFRTAEREIKAVEQALVCLAVPPQ
ncbi:low specificity L-threonine aldolase [Mesorhizobium sp. M7A.F.Ca.US.001.04.2.1]|nr:low specificity L-threonine aldolase [Mesorhizobium sp. M7A.F.Ca.US.001.04.2.1]